MYAELRHLDGACAGQTRTIRKEFVTLGRHPSADVRFDPERDLEVSGRHAAIFRQGDGWMVRDLGSNNGTWVNGIRVKGDRQLQPNDVIRFGPRGPQVAFLPQQGEPATIPMTRPSPPAPAGHPERSEGSRDPSGRAGPRDDRVGSTTGRIRAEVRRQTAPWRRATIGLGVLALLGGLGAVLALRARSRAVAAERAGLLARTDSLLRQLQATSSDVAALDNALQQARRETQRLRVSLASEGVGAKGLDSLARELASDQPQHEAVLRAARLDAAAIVRQNGDAIGLVLSEFSDTHRVAGTGFAVRVRGDTGWIVTSRHLVTTANGGRAVRLGVIFNGSSQNFRADLAALADSADLALLTVRVRGGVPVVRGLGGAPARGDPVAILGFPFGLDFPAGSDWRKLGVSVSNFAGTIRRIREDAIEVDAYGASGSSGSPVFNAAGLVTGVIYGGDPQTAGRIVYAVPASALTDLLRKAGVF